MPTPIKHMRNGLFAAALGVSPMAQAEPKPFFEPFAALKSSQWHVANYRWNHPLFDTDWDAGLVQINTGLRLTLRPSTQGNNGFDGASIRRSVTSGFGRYSAVLKPAKGAGLVTGFFTYTGPHFGSKHNEIDIEVLGKDTNCVKLAVFTDGVMWQKQVRLGFDAAERAHLFAFDWTPTEIRWFVDGELIATYDKTQGPVPQVPGYIYTNIWAADHKIASWAGRSAPDLGGQSEFFCVSFTPQGVAGKSCPNPTD